ncbi:MAG: alpha-D-ribose 1-methylphosphonate 5-triphosphate diphosphatase [Burkholderiales bacterium]|jgi:alpha-D-ribose 1-methylphosphonate 5-triphosphate diphosphatase|nr:alpha-D-ribose 1-methylphosphonate 5-triphosphate diphosphatase [Burkholderiales bacterium]
MWLSNFTIIGPDKLMEGASLRIEDGLIAEIVPRAVPGGVDGEGRLLCPGFIDMHGDMIEVEVEPRAGVDFPKQNAIAHLDARMAACGFTTAYAAVSFCTNSFRGERRSRAHTEGIIRALHEARPHCRIDHRIHARFDIDFPDAKAVLSGLLAGGLVDLVSLMDHTPGQGQYRDIERHIAKIARQKSISIETAHSLVMDRIESAGPEADRLNLLEQFATLARQAGIKLASHDDDTERKLTMMLALGAVISEFPITLDVARTATAMGISVAMGAPNAMRGQSYSGNLSAREAHAAGCLHILASDYHPASMLPAILTLAETDPAGLCGAIRLGSTNSAEALGLHDRGALVPGLRADIAIVDLRPIPRVVATLSEGRLAYSSGFVPFAR